MHPYSRLVFTLSLVLFYRTAFGTLSLLPNLSLSELLTLEASLLVTPTLAPEAEASLLQTQFALADAYLSRQEIHAQQEKLRSVSARCQVALASRFERWEGELKSQVIYLCWMNEAEAINYFSAVGAYFSSYRLEEYYRLASEAVAGLRLEDKLYAEGRIYSALPKLYGQSFRKALVSLQMLSRLKSTAVAEPWIQKIRISQGNLDTEEESSRQLTLKQIRSTSDGKNFGLFPMVYGSAPQGFGLQLRIQDDALLDTDRSFRARIYGSHRGSVGMETRYVDSVSLEETTLIALGHFLYGIQEFHGLGIDSAREATELYHTFARLSLVAQKQWQPNFYFQLGWRLQSAHLRRLEGGSFNSISVRRSSNSFDSGAVAELGFDNRDSAFDPYLGRLVFLRGHFPVAGILSNDSYQKAWAGWDEYVRLGLRYTLRVSAALVESSLETPYWDYASLSGSVSIPGVALNRFQERSLFAAWTELRMREWDPLTVFCFFNLGTVARDFNSLFRETIKGGLGVGGEMRLSRFRPRAIRAEIGVFGSELIFKMSLGVPIE